MGISEQMRNRVAKPQCFGDPEFYDARTVRCGNSCIHRGDCRKIVDQKTRSSVLSGRGVPARTPGSIPVKEKPVVKASERRSRYPMKNYVVHDEETWGQRLARECAASAISAMGFEVGNFFDDDNFRFQVVDEEPTRRLTARATVETSECSTCGYDVPDDVNVCPGCGVRLE